MDSKLPITFVDFYQVRKCWDVLFPSEVWWIHLYQHLLLFSYFCRMSVLWRWQLRSSPSCSSPSFRCFCFSCTWGVFTSALPGMWNVLRPRVCSDSVLPLWRMLLSEMDAFCSWLFISCLSCVAARSPIFSHLSSSLQGLWTIRAFGAQERQKHAFDAHQDLHSGWAFTHDGMRLGIRW